jgi:hypothetical protein
MKRRVICNFEIRKKSGCFSDSYFNFTASPSATEEEIQHRITLGNKAYYASQFLFKSRLVCKKLNLKLYWRLIRPTVTYVCETWALKETTKNKLMVFERKVLRKIFGPTKERDGT